MRDIPIVFIEDRIKDLSDRESIFAKNDALALKKLINDWIKCTLENEQQ